MHGFLDRAKYMSLSILLLFALSFIASFSIFGGSAAYADSSLKASDGWTLIDSCEWQLNKSTHVMTIRPAGNGASGTCQEYMLPLGLGSNNVAIDKVVFQGNIKLTGSSCSFMFSHMDNLLEIEGLGNLDISDIPDISDMFANCPSLEKVDLKGLKTTNVTKMGGLFFGCSLLKSVDLSGFDTSYVTNMESMFWGCSSLKSVNLSNFKTSRTLNMSGMFYDCKSLTSLDISSFDTSRVTSASTMFFGCSSLSYIKVGSSFTLQSELPEGAWRDARGYTYNDTIPVGVPGSFTYLGTVPSVSISASSKTIKLSGNQVTLTAKVNSNNWWGSVKWSSSNPLVASVDSYGVVTPQGVGATTITATADRATAICTVTVIPDSSTTSQLIRSKSSFTVKWKKPSAKSAKQITGYKIRYSTNKNMRGSKTKTVKLTSSSGKKCSLKITKLKPKKRYYVQVATYKKIGGKTYLSSWSKAKVVKTK